MQRSSTLKNTWLLIKIQIKFKGPMPETMESCPRKLHAAAPWVILMQGILCKNGQRNLRHHESG